MNRIFAGTVAAIALAVGAEAAHADNVCAWTIAGAWSCGDGRAVQQVYTLPTQPNVAVYPVPTVAPTPGPLPPNQPPR